jgi:hypothetical protein
VKRGLVRPDGRHVAIGSGFALVGLPTMLALPTDYVTRTCWAFLDPCGLSSAGSVDPSRQWARRPASTGATTPWVYRCSVGLGTLAVWHVRT